MNVYLFELKANRKFVITWLIVMMCLGLLMVSFYPSISKDLDLFIRAIQNYPESIRALFGINLKTMGSITGYYSSFPLTCLLICSAMEAMILGVSILSKEVRDKTADFLFTKPLSRMMIITAKIKASATLLLISNIVLFTFMYFITISFSSGNFAFIPFVLLMLTLLIIQFIFLSLGMLISVILSKVKSPLPISMGVVFGFYAINSFADDKMRAFIPFKYFESPYILEHSSYEMIYLLLAFMLIIIFTVLTYSIYLKKDIHSV
jgi:ABC-2 type transport system permease protein